MSPWNTNQRLLAGTRGQIITLLRRDSHTVDELAQALGLTDNAVRAHLATLERDGIVQQRGVRRSSGKPSAVFELAPAAEQLFPKAYDQVLQHLLDFACERLPAEEVETLLREVGRRMALEWKTPRGDLGVRLEAGVEVLNELGGMAELEVNNGQTCLRSYSCPFAALVREHPEVCRLTGTLLTEVVGESMQARCHIDGVSRCRFTVAHA
jgi:predicted ArsR family transcriptional regulator